MQPGEGRREEWRVNMVKNGAMLVAWAMLLVFAGAVNAGEPVPEVEKHRHFKRLQKKYKQYDDRVAQIQDVTPEELKKTPFEVYRVYTLRDQVKDPMTPDFWIVARRRVFDVSAPGIKKAMKRAKYSPGSEAEALGLAKLMVVGMGYTSVVGEERAERARERFKEKLTEEAAAKVAGPKAEKKEDYYEIVLVGWTDVPFGGEELLTLYTVKVGKRKYEVTSEALVDRF